MWRGGGSFTNSWKSKFILDQGLKHSLSNVVWHFVPTKQIFKTRNFGKNSFQAEDFQKTPLSCLCVYRNPEFLSWSLFVWRLLTAFSSSRACCRVISGTSCWRRLSGDAFCLWGPMMIKHAEQLNFDILKASTFKTRHVEFISVFRAFKAPTCCRSSIRRKSIAQSDSDSVAEKERKSSPKSSVGTFFQDSAVAPWNNEPSWESCHCGTTSVFTPFGKGNTMSLLVGCCCFFFLFSNCCWCQTGTSNFWKKKKKSEKCSIVTFRSYSIALP